MHVALPPQIVDMRGICLNGFASLFSSCFDFSRDKQFFNMLVDSAVDNLSLDAVCCLRHECPDRLFFYLNPIGVDEMFEYTNRALQQCYDVWKRNGGRVSPWGCLVAIDVTSFEYYGERDEYVHEYVKPAGRNYKHIKVRKYATLSIIASRFKLCLCILPVKMGEKLPDLVDKLLASVRGVKIRCVVMDKEFYNVEVLNRIEACGLHYLVPIVRKESADQLYQICETADHWEWRYMMGRATRERKEVTGYFHEYYLGEYAGFITNRGMKTDTAKKLLELYAKRWNIENGFKEAKDFLIKTTSKNHAYRLLVYAISHMLANVQNIIRDTKFRVRYYETREVLRLILDPLTEKKEYAITKRLTVKF